MTEIDPMQPPELLYKRDESTWSQWYDGTALRCPKCGSDKVGPERGQ